MHINTFKLEEYLSQYEFSVKHLLCCSDSESFSMQEILAMASDEQKSLWDDLRLGYTEVNGMPQLRREIANKLYPGLSDNNILMFSGAEDGIFCALETLLYPGDHAIVLTPCYQSLLEIPRMVGADVTELPLQEENEWRIEIETIASAIKSNTKCIIINFPHNPTGQVIEQEELMSLVELCQSKGIWLFSDEVYRLLGSPKGPWASPAACLYDKAISLGVMSKAYGMAGLRIGWLACQNQDMLKKITQMKHYTTICNSAPSEIISLIAISHQEQILHRNNMIVSNNLNILEDFLKEHDQLFDWVRPQGGCVGYVKYKKGSVDAFCEKLVKEQSVLLMPASVYHHDSNHFRVGFGRKDLPEGLYKLSTFVS